FYWCVGTTEQGQNGKPVEAHVMADNIQITAGSALVLLRGDKTVNLAFAPGAWQFVYAASVLDGSPIAVEHWPGQVEEAR
ncbi:MAG TPA: hypothetical protein VGX03_18005, partial [Candidatus Binatia bacterium]|nr:hypothetical protein [Candidatus Binatia bacterium]